MPLWLCEEGPYSYEMCVGIWIKMSKTYFQMTQCPPLPQQIDGWINRWMYMCLGKYID